MAVVALDVVPSIPNYRFTSDLEGVTYIFDLRWNARAQAWFMDLLEEDETPIRHGMKLVLGTLIGSDTKSDKMPPGRFVVEDASGENTDATLDDFGVRVFLYYFDSEEVNG